MTIKKTVTYIADDGKEFQDEEECLKWEETLNAEKFKDDALLFDEYGDQLPLTPDSFQDACFIKAKTDEAARYMAKLAGDWETPWNYNIIQTRAGCWIYCDDAWKPAKDYLKIAELLKKILDI